MRSALVTGDRGFIGRHMAAELEWRGYRVTGCDIKDGVDARDLFHDSNEYFDLVVHCAAHVGGRADIDGRPLYVGAVNLALDGGLFEWALRTRPGRIVYYSSSAAYPVVLQNYPHPPIALREDDIDHAEPERPDASYGLVKVVGEQLAAMAEGEGLRVHVFRPFSGFGEDQDLDYPWPSFADRARRRQRPFTIWGDGTQARDWIHVDDVVAGTLACVEADVPGPVNLSTGVATDFTTLSRAFTAAAGYEPELDYRLAAPRGVTHRVGDPTKLHEVYRPQVSVEEGIARALAA